jgi:hypothetical protein
VTIEDVEDKEVQNMMNKPKLREGTTHIMEDMSDDEHIMFDRMNYKEKPIALLPTKNPSRNLTTFQQRLEGNLSVLGRPTYMNIMCLRYIQIYTNIKDPPNGKKSY